MVNNRVWIINYNAVPPHLATMFRHIAFAREMTKAGYEVRIFCASWIHNTSIGIDLDGGVWPGSDGQPQVGRRNTQRAYRRRC